MELSFDINYICEYIKHYALSHTMNVKLRREIDSFYFESKFDDDNSLFEIGYCISLDGEIQGIDLKLWNSLSQEDSLEYFRGSNINFFKIRGRAEWFFSIKRENINLNLNDLFIQDGHLIGIRSLSLDELKLIATLRYNKVVLKV